MVGGREMPIIPFLRELWTLGNATQTPKEWDETHPSSLSPVLENASWFPAQLSTRRTPWLWKDEERVVTSD